MFWNRRKQPTTADYVRRIPKLRVVRRLSSMSLLRRWHSSEQSPKRMEEEEEEESETDAEVANFLKVCSFVSLQSVKSL